MSDLFTTYALVVINIIVIVGALGLGYLRGYCDAYRECNKATKEQP